MKTEILIGLVRGYKQRDIAIPLHIVAQLTDRGVDIEAIEPWKSVPRSFYND